jgi:Kef-type K+ transport system membrane component KefB
LKNFLLYTLIILLITTILCFVFGNWKMGIFIGFIFGGVISSVGLVYSLKGREYVHKNWHNDYVDRSKKYRD